MKKFFHLHSKAFEDKGAANLKELWEKVKAEGYEGLSVTCETSFEKAADEKDVEGTFHVVFSSAREDRHGDVVYQEFDLKYFKKNPVFLDSHNYGSIEHILGKVSKVGVKDGKLQGDVLFALDNPKGLLAAKLAAAGFLNATSIGFIPREFDDEFNVLKSELLEISAVSVPANPDALFEKAVEDGSDPAESEPIDDEPSTDEPVEAPSPEPTARKVDPRAVARRAVESMKAERQKVLDRVADEIKAIQEGDPTARRRKVFRDIRRLLSEDIG